jgi:hypothetical protein
VNHLTRIEQLRAAENLLMWHDPEIEGDIKPLVDGYKILNVHFEGEFQRPWTSSRKFKAWATAHHPELIK